MRLGAAVRQHRFRLGISQEELAERADLHRTYIAGIESGSRNVTLKSVAKLAHALKVSVSELLSESEPPKGRLVEILLVEDEPDDATMVLNAFREAKLLNPIHLARDGGEALEYLLGDRQLPDLVLLDLGLPRIGGLEVLRRIKSNLRTAGLAVVVLTVSDREQDVQAARKLGALNYIVKPVEFENFSKIIPDLSLHWALLQKRLNDSRH